MKKLKIVGLKSAQHSQNGQIGLIVPNLVVVVLETERDIVRYHNKCFLAMLR